MRRIIFAAVIAMHVAFGGITMMPGFRPTLQATAAHTATPVIFWSNEARRAIVPAGPNGIFGLENYGNKFPGEAAVERFQLETGDVEEPEPLVLGGPPEGARRAIVESHVDPIVASDLADSMGNRLFLMNTVEARGNPVVKGEGIPGEPPVRSERRRDPLEGSAAVSPGW